MEIKISVLEVVSLMKEIQGNPSRIFEMVTMNVQKDVGTYLTNLMKAELTHILGRVATYGHLIHYLSFKGEGEINIPD